MKDLFIDIISFLKTLTFVDYVLYFAILTLIILVSSLIYLLKTANIEEEEEKNEQEEEFDIKEAVQEIKQEKPKTIQFTDYEKEQEEKAIISYEELINSKKEGSINYESENMIDDEVSVKKINLGNMTKEKQDEEEKPLVLNYEHEEAFLKALKQLQELLN